MRFTIYADVTDLTRTRWDFVISENKIIVDCYAQESRENTRKRTWKIDQIWSRQRNRENCTIDRAPRPSEGIIKEAINKLLANAVVCDGYHQDQWSYAISLPFDWRIP